MMMIIKRSMTAAIYTKTGDGGFSATGIKGLRLAKTHELYNFLGNMDELSCHLASANHLNDLQLPIMRIQSRLQDINSQLAANTTEHDQLVKEETLHLEKWIDEKSQQMPLLNKFILPGGGTELASRLHLARAVCRRAERSLVALVVESGWKESKSGEEPLKYLNRLSDWLFTAARFSNHQKGAAESFSLSSK